MGANVECRPETLAQFAVLGAVYARLLHGKRAAARGPAVERRRRTSKGTELTRGALQAALGAAVDKDFEFVGYVEGRDIFGGDVDVVVTDGFTGNVVLKTVRGRGGGIIADHASAKILATPLGKLGALFLRGAFARAQARRSTTTSTAARRCVGVDGIAVLCARRGLRASAIKNGIRVAAGFGERRRCSRR